MACSIAQLNSALHNFKAEMGALTNLTMLKVRSRFDIIKRALNCKCFQWHKITRKSLIIKAILRLFKFSTVVLNDAKHYLLKSNKQKGKDFLGANSHPRNCKDKETGLFKNEDSKTQQTFLISQIGLKTNHIYSLPEIDSESENELEEGEIESNKSTVQFHPTIHFPLPEYKNQIDSFPFPRRI